MNTHFENLSGILSPGNWFIDSAVGCCVGAVLLPGGETLLFKSRSFPSEIIQCFQFYSLLKRGKRVHSFFGFLNKLSKMPENEVQYKKALVLEISPQISNTCSEAELNSNPGSGLTQKIANHTMENNFHFSPGSVQFFKTPLTSHLRFC